MNRPRNLDDLLFVAYQSGRSDGREEALRGLLIELQQENLNYWPSSKRRPPSALCPQVKLSKFPKN